MASFCATRLLRVLSREDFKHQTIFMVCVAHVATCVEVRSGEQAAPTELQQQELTKAGGKEKGKTRLRHYRLRLE